MSDLKIGDRTLVTSLERNAYAQLRRKYLENAYSERDEFLIRFSETFSDADDLFHAFPDYLEKVVRKTTETALADIVAQRIFDVDEHIFGKRFASHLAGRETQFDQLHGKYQAIMLSAAELQAYREERAANRAEIMGGGFGIEGAMRGMVFAAVANTALGMAHGLVNAAGSAVSATGDKRKKAELFDDPATRNGLADAVFDTAFQAHLAVAEIINERGNTPPFALVSVEDEAKASALLNNVVNGRVSTEAQADVLFEALSLNPFAKEIWFEWLSRFGDKDGSVGVTADSIGIVEFDDWKRELIAQRKDTLSWNTPEECQANSVILEQQAEWLGFPFDAERMSIEELAEKRDRERRIFNGIEYPSLAAVAAARQAHDEDRARISEQIREQNIAASNSTSFFGWLTLAYRRYRSTEGRSCRKEFFMFALAVIAVTLACAVFSIVLASQVPVESALPAVPALFGLLFLLASAVTALTLQIRRFHDQNKSGWFVLLNLIPYVGWLIVLAFMLVDGTAGDNRYGPDPKQR